MFHKWDQRFFKGKGCWRSEWWRSTESLFV